MRFPFRTTIRGADLRPDRLTFLVIDFIRHFGGRVRFARASTKCIDHSAPSSQSPKNRDTTGCDSKERRNLLDAYFEHANVRNHLRLLRGNGRI